MTGAFSEQTILACFYRGELLGLLAIHLILLSVNKINPNLLGSVHIYSDCLGDLDKVKNLPPHRIPSKCRHSDVLKIGGPADEFPANIFEPGKISEKVSRANTTKNKQKQADHGLTGGGAFNHDLFPPPLPPPPRSKNNIPFTRESVYFSTLPHNARGVRWGSIGEMCFIFAPPVFVSDKNAHRP
jgi:hypothetical protein